MKTDTLVFALGGLGEVGKNMYCVEHGDELIIIDAGITFPQGEILGVDYVIQDFTYLKENESKIKGLFITHGHEDHIGSIPFLLQMVNIPDIYAPNQAMGLIRRKLEDRNIRYDNLHVYTEKDIIKFKNMEISFFLVTHSIPDAHGMAIHTPNGTIVTTGDFKFDLTPIGPMSNLYEMARLGNEGVTLLLSESTNVLNEGLSKSESLVDNALNEIFDSCDTRIIIATFASNIYRLKHILETCKKHGRKVAVFGRSMDNNIDISIEGGYITSKDVLVTPEEANKLKPSEVCLLCTGTQGEPLSALSRIANGTHKSIKLQQSDIVIFSSSAIPGNALAISKTINKLCLQGVKVFTTSSLSNIHASGHGNKEELKLMLRLMKPKYLMPIHGEYRMLKEHTDVASECGIPKENSFVCGNGDVLAINDGVVRRYGTVTAGDVYVDGNRIGEVGNAVMKDRKIMATDGIVVVIANLDTNTNTLLNKPNITTRGFVLVNENQDLISELEGIAAKAISSKLSSHINYADIKSNIIAELGPYIFEKTGRKPIILPVIMNVKKDVKINS